MNTSKLFMPLDRFAVRLKKLMGKKLHSVDQNGLDHCKLEMYLHFIRSNIGVNGNR